MKITDISSDSKPSEEVQDEDAGRESENKNERKRTLLQRYDIPIEHLDFSYVNKCTDGREVERILRILRSGEEGTFPDLERCVATRLEKLNPKSHLLRVETPAIRTTELGNEEQEAIHSGLEEWLNEVKTKSSTPSTKMNAPSEIFGNDQCEEDTLLKSFPLPIRGSAAAAAQTVLDPASQPANKKKDNGRRIKSCEYDKWDKYDVDAELTKLDITDMQREEWEMRERPKVIEEQKRMEKLMKSTDDDEDDNYTTTRKTSTSNVSSLETAAGKADSENVPKLECMRNNRYDDGKKKEARPFRMPVEKPSYIEEVNDEDDEEGVKVNTSAYFAHHGPRKARIVIEDVNLPM